MTAAKDRKNKAELSFKTPSLDQLWSCLQRCLFFEEPSGRWSRIISQVARHLNGKNKDLDDASFSEQQTCFQAVFGTPEDILDETARAFNLLLAMKDLELFGSAEFDIWLLSQSNDDESGDDVEAEATEEEEFKTLAESLLKKLEHEEQEPTQAQILYLQQAWHTVPYWRVVESAGPWAEDALAIFVARMLDKLDKLQPGLSTANLLNAFDEFNKLLKEERTELPSNFLPTVLVLVEGNTEAVVLPKFVRLSGINPQEISPFFIPCGGANQLLRKFLHLRDITTLPILCILDDDAIEQSATIEDLLRERDRLHVWRQGEIEDTFPSLSLLETLNAYLHSLGVSELLSADQLKDGERRTEQLDRIWRARGLGDFDKVGFAQFQTARIKQSSDIPDDAKKLLKILRSM